MAASPRLMSSTYNLACFRTTSPMALNGFVIGGGRASRWQRQRGGLGARRFKHQSAQCSFLEKRRRAHCSRIRLAIVPFHCRNAMIVEIFSVHLC